MKRIGQDSNWFRWLPRANRAELACGEPRVENAQWEGRAEDFLPYGAVDCLTLNRQFPFLHFQHRRRSKETGRESHTLSNWLLVRERTGFAPQIFPLQPKLGTCREYLGIPHRVGKQHAFANDCGNPQSAAGRGVNCVREITKRKRICLLHLAFPGSALSSLL
jgi:hypothetical protein